MKDTELEVKFYVRDLSALETRLQALGASLVQPRVHETNLRFDTPAGNLGSSGQVLRLRRDADARITYKGPGELQGGVRARREIEFFVSDFDAAWAMIHALGYDVSLMYEKYRATYDLGDVHITLDEMPYGSFAEIEGPDPESIREIAGKLQLDWEARSNDSYTTLFERVKAALGLSFRDLSFANFKDLHIEPGVMGLQPAG